MRESLGSPVATELLRRQGRKVSDQMMGKRVTS
jgi:hypothetical protein